MDRLKLLQRFLFTLFFVWSGQLVMGQEGHATGQELRVTGQELLIKGTVYDRSQAFGLPNVSVMGTSGSGTVTDSLGNYHIHLRAGDSIYFSYLGKFTAKTPVREINADQPFDMSLEVGIESLPAVFVRSKNYRMDSLETREEYRKVFDYQAGWVNDITTSKGGRNMGFGVDFDMLLRPGQVRRTLAFQKRLLEEEQDKYIDHRFSPVIVKRVTGMEPPLLDSFMRIYRPSYEFLQTMTTDYEFYKYISDCGKFYSENR